MKHAETVVVKNAFHDGLQNYNCYRDRHRMYLTACYSKLFTDDSQSLHRRTNVDIKKDDFRIWKHLNDQTEC
jgi:hypothetical protein